MHTLTVNLWTVGSDNKLRAVGHTEPRPEPGDYCIDTTTGEITRFVQGPHNLQMWPLWMFQPEALLQSVS